MRSALRRISHSARAVRHGLDTSCCPALYLVDEVGSQCRGLKKQANELRVGNVIVLQDKLYEVVKYNYSQGHGRQLGVVQMDVKAVEGGLLQQERRRPQDMVEVAALESRSGQLLYINGQIVTLMDPRSFEQFEVDAEALFGEARQYLREGLEIILQCTPDGVPIKGALPQTVVLEVVETEPSVRGDTTVFKAARLASGARISVPQYIAQGERVLVDTHTGAFAGRAET